MKRIETSLPGVVLFEPKAFHDARGFFMETYNVERFREAGLDEVWVQDNHSRSHRGVLRGMHFQEPHGQGKLVRCASGAIFDAAVDIRVGSPTFGHWFGAELTEDNLLMMWVPPGFAHGFCTVSETADVLYKCSGSVYRPPAERSIVWNDPDVGIEWPIRQPLLSEKDAAAPRLKDATVLPVFR